MSTTQLRPSASLAGPSLNGLLADARIAQNEARNLMGTLGQVAPADRPAVRAEMRALYAKAAELRERADEQRRPSA